MSAPKDYSKKRRTSSKKHRTSSKKRRTSSKKHRTYSKKRRTSSKKRQKYGGNKGDLRRSAPRDYSTKKQSPYNAFVKKVQHEWLQNNPDTKQPPGGLMRYASQLWAVAPENPKNKNKENEIQERIYADSDAEESEAEESDAEEDEESDAEEDEGSDAEEDEPDAEESDEEPDDKVDIKTFSDRALKKMLKNLNVSKNIPDSKAGKEAYIRAAEGARCNASKRVWCDGELVCDIDNEEGVCLSEEFISQYTRGLQTMKVNGKKVIGSKEAIDALKQSLKSESSGAVNETVSQFLERVKLSSGTELNELMSLNKEMVACLGLPTEQ